jgi:hypothetical protein
VVGHRLRGLDEYHLDASGTLVDPVPGWPEVREPRWLKAISLARLQWHLDEKPRLVGGQNE